MPTEPARIYAAYVLDLGDGSWLMPDVVMELIFYVEGKNAMSSSE